MSGCRNYDTCIFNYGLAAFNGRNISPAKLAAATPLSSMARGSSSPFSGAASSLWAHGRCDGSFAPDTLSKRWLQSKRGVHFEALLWQY